MLGENWSVSSTDRQKEKQLAFALSISELTARILVSRGYDTPEKARQFLKMENIELYDPFLLKDMDKACERIHKAIENRESICIYGDYDVDGVTSTAALYLYLTSHGASCKCFIPERLSEGYGLNKAAIEEMAGKIDLIITVDTGITAIEEANFASELGIDLVITDHHSCRETIPDVCAVVNPHRLDDEYPFKQLAGVGVVFKLMCALEGNTERIFNEYADLIAIGTVADVMPIIDENRLIADVGIRKLETTERVGLMALMDNSGVTAENGKRKVYTSTVGYTLAPRLNAAGRIASARKSLNLLLENDYYKANALALELCEINKKRQNTEQTIYEEAIKQIGIYHGSGERYSYILHSDGWHQGVVGVVASKISEKYSLPAILFSFDGDIGKGSGRSIKGLSLTDLLWECKDLLIEYGGHELAAGLSIERKNLDKFIEKFEKFSKQSLEGKNTLQTVCIDCEVFFNEINNYNIRELSILEPFGLSNPIPQFIIKNVYINDIISMADDKHIRLKIRENGGKTDINAVYFGMSHCEFPFVKGNICEIACTLNINEFKGLSHPQVMIQSVRPCEAERKQIYESRKIYESCMNPEDTSPIPRNEVPDLNDFREVFRAFKRELGDERKRISIRYLRNKLETENDVKISLCKLKLIIDVMAEFGLADAIKIRGNDIIELKLLPYKSKVDIEKSEILKRIKRRIK